MRHILLNALLYRTVQLRLFSNALQVGTRMWDPAECARVRNQVGVEPVGHDFLHGPPGVWGEDLEHESHKEGGHKW